MERYTDPYGNVYEMKFMEDNYVETDGLAILAYCNDGDGWWEPYATVTVCLPGHELGKDCAFLDTNNCGHLVDWMLKKGYVKETGRCATSGFCTYPEGKFDPLWLTTLEPF